MRRLAIALLAGALVAGVTAAPVGGGGAADRAKASANAKVPLKSVRICRDAPY
jgi:hypothetical protein